MMGLPYGENFITLSSTVFYDTPVWQTDGQTVEQATAYSALSIICYMLSRAKKRHTVAIIVIIVTVYNTVYRWE